MLAGAGELGAGRALGNGKDNRVDGILGAHEAELRDALERLQRDRTAKSGERGYRREYTPGGEGGGGLRLRWRVGVGV